MKTHSIYRKNDLLFAGCHPRYHIKDGKLTIVMFWNCFPAVTQNVAVALSDEDAARYLAGDGQDIPYDAVFAASQLGLSEDTGWWRMSDISIFDPSDPNYGSAESEPPCVWYVMVDPRGKLYGPVNKHIVSYDRKSTMWRDALIEKSTVLCSIVTTKSNPAITDCRIALSYVDALGFYANFTATDLSHLTSQERQADMKASLPQLACSGPGSVAAGEAIDITVSLVDPETQGALTGYTMKVYVETTGGYINKQRVTVGDYGVPVRFRALDLQAGDQVKVKFGWRNVTGLAEHIIDIV